MVLNSNGIFNRATDAKTKYGQAKARETLELLLSEAQMQKFESGLTEEELDNKIAEIGGELLPKEKPNKNLQNVIVDGYIFEIDRSVPRIVDYIGQADGVVITAMIMGNNGWVKPEETISVSGVIKTYSGGTITSSNATVIKGNTTITGFPTTGGNYTIANISEDTNIKITATDSNGKTAEKTINVVIKRDGTAPTVETLTAEAEGLKIKFNATGHDRDASGQEGSGIHHFNYIISSKQDTTLEGIPVDKRTGTFKQGQIVEIETTPTRDREETTYTIKVTATDNCNNTTLDENSKTKEITVIDGLTIAQAKELVNVDTLPQYMGKRIIDYKPTGDPNGKYRIFYFDGEESYFGEANKLYLKRQVDGNVRADGITSAEVSQRGIQMMERMNPLWKQNNLSQSENVRPNMLAGVSWLADTDNWSEYAIPRNL